MNHTGPENPYNVFTESLKRFLDEIISQEIEKNFKKFLPQQEEQDVIFIDEASRITGLARQTIYQLIETNKIPYLPKGGRKKLAFSRISLLTWMEGR